MIRIRKNLFLVFSITLIIIISILTNSYADSGYFTTYGHHITEGELEIMLINDFTSPSKYKREEGQGDYLSQMPMIEYHVSKQFAVEFMLEAFEDVISKEVRFTGFRYEARYRLFENEVFLNPTLYAEYEDLDIATRFKMEVSGWVVPPYEEEEQESTREKILESRIIFSQDLGQWNLAFNWINESDLKSGVTAFGYSLGVLYRVHAHYNHEYHDKKQEDETAFIRMGSLAFELLGALGDTKKFGIESTRQEHYFQPSLMFHLGYNTMLSLGFAIGLSEASDDLVRISTGWEF